MLRIELSILLQNNNKKDIVENLEKKEKNWI